MVGSWTAACSLSLGICPGAKQIMTAAVIWLAATIQTVAAGNAAEVSFPTQAKPGNIFTSGEKVEIEAAIRTGSTVDWVVSDFQGKKVDNGTTAVAEGKACIVPHIVDNGYYLMRLTSKTAEQDNGHGQTSYAVIAAAETAERVDRRFGVAGQFEKKHAR